MEFVLHCPRSSYLIVHGSTTRVVLLFLSFLIVACPVRAESSYEGKVRAILDRQSEASESKQDTPTEARGYHAESEFNSDGGTVSAVQANLPSRRLGGRSLATTVVEPRSLRRLATGNVLDQRPWILSTLTSLGIVISLVIGMRWAWSKMGGRIVTRKNSAVEVLARSAVAPRNHILLVRVGGRILILSDSSAGLRTLADVVDPEEVASILQSVTAHSDQSISRGFSQLLGRFNKEYDLDQKLDLEGGDEAEHRFDRARNSVSSLRARIQSLKEGAKSRKRVGPQS